MHPTPQPAPPPPAIRAGMIHRGGSWWECAACGSYHAAPCHCCEPRPCGCKAGR